MKLCESAFRVGSILVILAWVGSGCSDGGTSRPIGPPIPPQTTDKVCNELRKDPKYEQAMKALAARGYADPGALAAAMLLASEQVPELVATCTCL